MKKILTLALLPSFLLVFYSSAQVTSVKKVPESTKDAVIKANSIVNVIRMNPEIPFEEHAFLITNDNAFVYGVPPGKIVVLPHGDQVIQVKSKSYTGKIILDFAFEPGKYYYFEINKISKNKYKPNIVVLTDEGKLEIAKQEVAKIKENLDTCLEYLEYSKQHPNALDGTYKYVLSKIVIKDNRLSWNKEFKEMGIIYDGETIILLGDRVNKADFLFSYIWHYHFNDDGNLSIMIFTDPILEGKGYVTSSVFKPVPENP